MTQIRRELPTKQKKLPPRRAAALKIHVDDLNLVPMQRYADAQRKLGRLISIGKVDVDIDQIIYRKFLCDRHRCIQWTPPTVKAKDTPIIDRSCCSSYTVPLTDSDRKQLEEILPLVRKRLAKNHPLVLDPDEPVFDIEDDFSFALRETDKGTCEFVLYEKGLTTCAVHKTCLEEGLDVWEYKPVGCSLWPLAIVDYDRVEGDTKEARYFLTAYAAATSGLFEGDDDDDEDKFACMVDQQPEYEPLYKSQEGIIRYLLGDPFYVELEQHALRLAQAQKQKRSGKT